MPDLLSIVFQGVPYVEGNGMSSLYKLQVKTAPPVNKSMFVVKDVA